LFITLQQYGYFHHIVMTRLCSSHCDNMVMASHVHHIATIWLYSSNCDNMVMTRHARHIEKNIVMATHVLHIATISLCSSHCDNMVMANHVQPLSTMVNHSQQWSCSIVTLSIWLWPTIVNHSQPLLVNHGQWSWSISLCRHIVTIWIWPTMFNHCQPWSTIVNHGHGQSRSTIFMFVTLRQYGYVRHIICSAYKARLYVVFSHYDDRISVSQAVRICSSH
jgi:hypothetical protein